MKKLLILSLTLISSIAMASELNVPNQFEDGQVTSAEQMNANFDAIQAAVNDNHARIESMQQPTKAVFQGFSTDSMNGGQGLIAMQQACHNFVSGSHICNTTEFAESPFNASAVETMSGNAWILQDVVTADEGWLINKNGLEILASSANCIGWNYSSDGADGSSLTSLGAITPLQCDYIAKVACCK
jgi:hypothetical protein